jgi:hypothetical protein
MKAYGLVVVQIHIFLTSALIGGEWSASRPGRFIPRGRTHGTHWTGGWVGPRAGLDYEEKRKFLTLPWLELRPLGRPAPSRRYPDYAVPIPCWVFSFSMVITALTEPLASSLFSSVIIFFTQTIGLLGRVIRPSQDRYLYTGHTPTSMPWRGFELRYQRSSERRQFMP